MGKTHPRLVINRSAVILGEKWVLANSNHLKEKDMYELDLAFHHLELKEPMVQLFTRN